MAHARKRRSRDGFRDVELRRKIERRQMRESWLCNERGSRVVRKISSIRRERLLDVFHGSRQEVLCRSVQGRDDLAGQASGRIGRQQRVRRRVAFAL